MQLARAAAARTLTNWAEPESPPEAAPPSAPPAEPQPDAEQAPHANPAPRHPAGQPATPTAHKPTDPAVLFTRFAAVVRDCIALEARLSAGQGIGPTPRAETLQRRADPRRAPLRDVFRRTIENHPDRTDLNREFAARLDEHLVLDPDQTIDPGILLFTIADELNIEIDLAHIPDEYLTAYAETTDPDDEAPDPRATSPP